MPDSVVKVQKFVPEHFLEVIAKNLPAIMNAVNGIHGDTESLIQGCIDQLFLSTASGRFLIQNGESRGFTMPANSGLDIRAYRVLVPIMVADPKQVRITVNELVRAFYGTEKTRPSISASIFSPYSLQDGDDLIIETESGRVTIAVVEGQVSDLNNVSAAEIAAIINSTQDLVDASVLRDRLTGNDTLRISSNTSASMAFIRIVGGKMQNILKFPNYIETLNSSSTTWNLTKTSIYTDELVFTWDGVGTNPNIYQAKAGDVVTIRGLIDGAQNFSDLNGSYELVDVGYDYFIIRNDRFDHTAATLTQNLDNNIIFTSDRKVTLFDKDEYALTTETEDETITVTVPAVPPLARRFLAGSSHIHGSESEVLDFTRTSIKIALGTDADKPVGENWFVLASDRLRYDFRRKYYNTTLVDNDLTEPTYIINTGDDQYSVLPYVVPTSIDTDPIYGELDESIYEVHFPYRHGICSSWGFTLQNATGEANVTAAMINQEHVAKFVPNDNSVRMTVKDSSGNPVPFEGIDWGVSADIYRQSALQADGSDFRMVFSSVSNRIASGLEPGVSFRLDPAAGTDVVLYLANFLKFRKLSVTSASGSEVTFTAGVGPGTDGLIISSAEGKRSGFFGGPVEYFVDKTSTYNQENLFPGLRAAMVGYTQSSNPLYVSPYLYDPEGTQTNVTISKFVVRIQENIKKGESKRTLLIDTATVDGEALPQTGSLIIDYGSDRLEGPIRFSAVLENPGSSQIIIDPAYKFKFSHSSGAQIHVVHDSMAYVPSITGEDYPFYLTGTVAARDTMFELLELLVAAGIFVEEDILLPNLRYDDPSIEPFD